jgi:TolB-like protein
MANPDFFQRLKERKLVQWALAYLAGAFVVFQGVEVLAEPWSVSLSFQRAIHLLLLVGFFIALALAWYHGEKGQQGVTGIELIIIALLLGIGGGVLWILPAGDRRAPGGDFGGWTFDADLPTIAVLPFADLNRSDSTLVFADGLHDNLITHLHKIGSLHVISRQSVLQYRDSEKSIPTIARELGGIGTILEGSVQRSPDRVLVNVQLIEASNDSHLWSQEYDRPLTAENIFAIQTELAGEIAEKLGVRLTAAEEARLRGGGTGSLRALDLFDEALSIRQAAGANRQANEEIEAILREVIRLDPDFLEAYAMLGSCLSLRPQIGYSVAWADSGLVLARKALELDSLQAPGWGALGSATAQQGRLEESRDAFLRALELAPGHPEFILHLGATHFELGRYDQALFLAVRASRLSPNNPTAKTLAALTNSVLGRWNEALGWIEAAASDTASGELFDRTVTIVIELARGQVETARALARAWLVDEPESPFAKTQSVFLEALENLPAASRRAESLLDEHPDFDWFDSRAVLQQLIALDRMRAGDPSEARELLREQEARVSARVAEGYGGPLAIWGMGVLQLLQGNDDEALGYLASAADEGFLPESLLLGPPETDPRLASLRDDARFQGILRQIEETRTRLRERIEQVADQLRPPTPSQGSR